MRNLLIGAIACMQLGVGMIAMAAPPAAFPLIPPPEERMREEASSEETPLPRVLELLNAEYPEVRLAALEEVVWRPAPEALDAVADLAANDDSSEVRAAAKAAELYLRHLDAPDAQVQALNALHESGNNREKLTALRLLGRIDHREAKETVVRSLRHLDLVSMGELMAELPPLDLGEEGDVLMPKFERYLLSWHDLAKGDLDGGPRATSEGLRAVKEAYWGRRLSGLSAEEIIEIWSGRGAADEGPSMVSLPDRTFEVSLPILIDLVRDSSLKTIKRAYIAGQMGIQGCAQAADDLLAIAADPDEPARLRGTALLALSRLGEGAAIPVMMSAVTNELNDPAAVRLAVASLQALARMANSGFKVPLEEEDVIELLDGPWPLPLWAVDALKTFGGARARDAMEEILATAPGDLRDDYIQATSLISSARRALPFVGDEDTLPMMLETLYADDPEQRVQATIAVTQRGIDAAAGVLLERLREEPSQRVRWYLMSGIVALDPQLALEEFPQLIEDAPSDWDREMLQEGIWQAEQAMEHGA